MIIILIILMGILLFLMFMWNRNEKVSKEKLRFLEETNILAKKYIAEDRDDWKKAYNKFDSVSYYEMVLKFWKPVKSFYK